MTDTPRTTVTMRANDGTADHHFEFKGYLTITEAGTRIKALIRANPRLNHTVRGHLLSCVDICDYDVYHTHPTETTESIESPSLGDDPYWQAVAATTPTTPTTPTHIPSLNAADTAGAYAPRKPNPQYTGTAVLGIATMHKSNLVPIFNSEAAVDAAIMRRN